MNPDDLRRPAFLPSGVAEPTGRAGYVMTGAGTVEALDLSTGQPLWDRDLSARPVYAFDDRLAALSLVARRPNVMRVVVLDAGRRGKQVRVSRPIPFPDWVSPTIVPDESFDYRVHVDGRRLVLDWEAHARYRGGAPPPPSIVAQATKDAAGTVRVDLMTGAVEMLAAADRIPGVLEAPGPAVAISYQMGASAAWRTDPWSAGSKLAALRGDIAGDQHSLYLQTWNRSTGELDQRTALVTGKALVSYVTMGGDHVFVHSESPAPANEPPWWVFSARTGQRLATLKYEPGTQEPCVVDGRVYYMVERPSTPPAAGARVGRMLKAMDLISAELLWERLLSERRSAPPPALRP